MVTAKVAKRLLAQSGEVRSQPSSNWTGDFSIPFEVEQFYREVGPFNVTIESPGGPYFLPCLADLWQLQAGYRWKGQSGVSIEDWPDDWLVVADGISDPIGGVGEPFIFVRSSGLVLHAFFNWKDRWDVSEMFPDLNTMAACLAQLGAVVHEAGDDFTDENCAIRFNYRTFASARIQELLGSKSEAEAVLGKLRWDSMGVGKPSGTPAGPACVFVACKPRKRKSKTWIAKDFSSDKLKRK
jgi:hypothetical protein